MPASMTTTLHIGAEHVTATDLTDHHRQRSDLASLALGDQNTKVVLLGSLATLRAIVRAANSHLDEVETRRQPSRQVGG